MQSQRNLMPPPDVDQMTHTYMNERERYSQAPCDQRRDHAEHAPMHLLCQQEESQTSTE